MTLKGWKLATAAVALLSVPQIAAADAVEDQLKAMQDRMAKLEDALGATNEQLQAANEKVDMQATVIEKAGLDDARTAESWLSRFIEETEFEGWVAVSYNYNFHSPDDTTVALGNVTGGTNRGRFGLTAPYHPDANTFSMDQIWFGMRKRASEESRAGMGIQMTYGKTGDILGNTLGGGPIGALLSGAGASAYNAGNGSSLYVYEGYVEYLAPIWNGIDIKAGRFATLVGYETVRAIDNPNITRGLLFAVQPINHTGVLATTQVMDNWSMSAGVANDAIRDWNFETDNSKAFIGQVKYTGSETFGFAVNGVIGGDYPGLPGLLAVGTTGAGRDSDHVGILDLVMTWTPNEVLHTWMNVDAYFADDENIPGNVGLWGIAGGGRLQVSEKTGVAVRAELLQYTDYGAYLGTDNSDDITFWELTGTVDHALTEDLTLRLETRIDGASIGGGGNDVFTCRHDCAAGAIGFLPGSNTSETQVLGLIELLYRF